MSELLSREKDFRKINEELNKLATTALETQQQQQQNASVSYQTKGDGRFQTYTKSKGQSTLLRRRGGGDGYPDGIMETSNTSRGDHRSNTWRDNQRSIRQPANKVTQPISSIPKVTTPTSSSPNSQRTDDNVSQSTAAPSHISTLASHRKQLKGPESSTRTFSRTSNGRTGSTNSATFTVKYRNPKFVQSPSLEVLVKDESAALKHKTFPSARAPTDVESVTSTSTGNGHVPTTRTNQIPGTTKKVSTEGLIKFLKSKIAILEENHERITQEMTQQKELLEKTLERHKKVEQQRDQAYAKHNAISEQLNKVETQLEEANRRVKERVVEYSTQQKELEVAKRELKLLTQTNTNLEKRLYRANEELENAKNALTQMKNADRDLKEAMRVDGEGKEKQIKSLKKQRADLLNAYKKQLYLIDNLKRQNVCLEQAKLISFGDKEFSKLLDWNVKT